jgi:hypothetical protein
MRSTKVRRALPSSSLLRLLPVRDAIEDPYFSCVERPIDINWQFARFTDSMGGFSPIRNVHYYPATSPLAQWLRDPLGAGRELNFQDRMVLEVLRMSHDYLHSWAYRVIEEIDPSVGVGAEPVTRANLNHFAFVHLLTEAAAVVGLDYWYLCVKDVAERCTLGSLAGPQTVEYREQHVREYRRFNPKLNVQSPDFFLDVVRLFCVDEMSGFSLEDLEISPALSTWLVRELKASPCQRLVTKMWLAYLGGFRMLEVDARKPLPALSQRQREIAAELGRRLWRKVKKGERQFVAPRSKSADWRYRADAAFDFRYMNLQQMELVRYDWKRLPYPRDNFFHYLKQYVSQFRLPLDDAIKVSRLREDLSIAQERLDQSMLWKACSRLDRVNESSTDSAPLEMIFVN